MLFAHVRVRFIAWKDPWSVIEAADIRLRSLYLRLPREAGLGKD